MRRDSEGKHVRNMEKQLEKEESGMLDALRRGKRHRARNVLLALLGLIVFGAAAFYFVFDVNDWQTLDMNRITRLPQTGAVYDKDGAKVSSIKSAQNRVSIPLSSIPQHVRDAFLAAEDLRFYQHPGFDPVRIFGALIANIKSGDYSEGASTITQQLVKLSHLSTQKTVARKLEEIYLALQLESVAEKDEILEMYLNFIYFGRGAYGIEAAARAYFGISASSLSTAQAATLAAVIKAPSAFAPHLNADANTTRRSYILSVMRENDMLSESEYRAALSEEIALADAPKETAEYGWYIDATLDEAERVLGISSEALLAAGYNVYTALDTDMQDVADAQYLIASNFPDNASDGTPAQSAMACVDVQNGAVRAVVGGREYLVQRGLNRATQMKRQPGSAIKPLAVYAPAMEWHGYTAASVLDDTPKKFGNYAPRNSGYQYYGNVTVRTALKYSLNVPAVETLNDIGVQTAINYLQSVGMAPDVMDGNLSLALGSMTYGVSPVQLAAAYAPFANGGTYYEPYFIESITDAGGREIYRREPSGARVLSRQTAVIMNNVLQSVTSGGTGAKLSGAGLPIAGKTGTVNMEGGNRDIWMAAYNSSLSTAFWMGFDNPDSKHKLPSWASGGDYTAALATKVFRNYYQGREKPDFLKADGLVWLKIDKKAIEWTGEVMLASNLTPAQYVLTEIFNADNRPTKVSNVWKAPKTPSAFYVTHNDSGKPVLVITASDAALFRIQRDAVGECIILNEIYGNNGETVYYTDTRANVGVVYTYRIIPINYELLNNGILLEGEQAVQIAQAKSAASSFWRDITDLLFGESKENKESASQDDAMSMFWRTSD